MSFGGLILVSVKDNSRLFLSVQACPAAQPMHKTYPCRYGIFCERLSLINFGPSLTTFSNWCLPECIFSLWERCFFSLPAFRYSGRTRLLMGDTHPQIIPLISSFKNKVTLILRKTGNNCITFIFNIFCYLFQNPFDVIISG